MPRRSRTPFVSGIRSFPCESSAALLSHDDSLPSSLWQNPRQAAWNNLADHRVGRGQITAKSAGGLPWPSAVVRRSIAARKRAKKRRNRPCRDRGVPTPNAVRSTNPRLNALTCTRSRFRMFV